MVCSLMDLRCKEVVNIQNGSCLGCVCDAEFDTGTALICIGEDTVLVENVMCPAPPKRRSSLFSGALH